MHGHQQEEIRVAAISNTGGSRSSAPMQKERISKSKKRHPLKMPLRTDPVTHRTICRFHNYDRRSGCKKYNDQRNHSGNDDGSNFPICELDHETCHVCLQKGHLAYECVHMDDPCSVIWKEFSCLTLQNTRPDDYPSNKTALGDVIVWIGDTVTIVDSLTGSQNTITVDPPNILDFKAGEDDLLGRCRRQKRIEAAFMLQLRKGAVVVDVGAHLGDTVMTLALHARSKNRTDLRFVAIEPCPEKCAFLRSVVVANKLQRRVEVICAAVGKKTGKVQPAANAKDRARRDGSLRYEYCTESDDSVRGNYRTQAITLDSIVEKLSPMGMLHIDVEGWECDVLRGAKTLLTTINQQNDASDAGSASLPCYVIAEAWTEKECIRRGVEGNSEDRIVTVMEKEMNDQDSEFEFQRMEDIVDIERNLVYIRTRKGIDPDRRLPGSDCCFARGEK